VPPSVNPEAWGVQASYVDAFGTPRRAPPEAVAAALAAMGATPDGPPPTPAPDAGAGPAQCPLPADAPAWGWAVQLYAARSRESWGIGDLADLTRLGRWARDRGAGFLMVNPLHAATPVLPQDPSPYFPSSRRFRNFLYLRVEEVPNARGPVVDAAARAGTALDEQRLIDRDEVFSLKMAALEDAWSRFEGDAAFDAYVAEEGRSLQEWAVFCVLAETHGNDWRRWPLSYRHPRDAAVAAVARERSDRVRFHLWLQWLLDVQLQTASAGIDVMHDLAVGFAPGGADAWAWQDLLAPGISIGAPPDEFNTQGQSWGLPPFDPWKLRAAGYRPFIETIRAGVRHAGALRIDHALGLARLYWVPDGVDPKDGVYVRYPFEDLLDAIARESARAGAYVVAEDLGTSTPEILEALAARRLLSYRLVWFEEQPPTRFPELAMAAVTTHDLPTIAGLWSGHDLERQRELGLQPNGEGWKEIREHLRRLAGVDEEAPVADVIAAVHAALAQAPSLLVSATLDDAIAVEERPNMPGTTDQWPNWSIALPVPLEDLERHPLANRVAELLNRRR
jgi:4-alpha-glucanotransferase